MANTVTGPPSDVHAFVEHHRCSATQTAGHVHVPEPLVALDPQETGSAPAPRRAVALQQALLAHHPLGAPCD